jgi:hypothetical protein
VRWTAVAAAVSVVPASAVAAKAKHAHPHATKPAIAVSGVSASPGTAVARARVVVSARVRNGGRSAVRVQVVFYASANARRDKHDVKLGSARTEKLKQRQDRRGEASREAAGTREAGSLVDLRLHPRLTGVLPAGLTVTGIVVADAGNDQPGLRCTTLPAATTGGPFACELPNSAFGSNSVVRLVFNGAAPGDYPVSFTVTADNLPAPLQGSTTLTVPDPAP